MVCDSSSEELLDDSPEGNNGNTLGSDGVWVVDEDLLVNIGATLMLTAAATRPPAIAPTTAEVARRVFGEDI